MSCMEGDDGHSPSGSSERENGRLLQSRVLGLPLNGMVLPSMPSSGTGIVTTSCTASGTDVVSGTVSGTASGSSAESQDDCDDDEVLSPNRAGGNNFFPF